MTELLFIPTVPGVPDYTVRTRLDGRDFNLRFLWNQRASRWSMDIRDAEGVAVALGINIVTNWPLIRYYRSNPALPPGELYAFDTVNSDGDPPGLDELGIGKRVELAYRPVT